VSCRGHNPEQQYGNQQKPAQLNSSPHHFLWQL
jgi:hypothetical protein